MKNTFLALGLFLVSLPLFAQKSNGNNTLLWRISGNGLSRPSYLFGTMHLTDKKVFFLGDSLYRAIEQCEGFAAELDMNRLGMQMINHVINDRETKAATEAVRVKDAVHPELWNRYKDALAEKLDKPADKITVNDLEEIESALQSEVFTKGEMPTFLDAYLFGIARRMGKWVGGLEELKDQLEHLDADDIEEKIQMALFDDDYYRSGIDWMKKIYVAQQLDSLDSYLYREEESGRKDFIMIKRNLKMARGMDSLSAIRSTFFAVGAAHLPGDSGVISLLRGKGYTVSPVYAAKKINPDKYQPKLRESAWQKVPVKDNAYTLYMPGLAEGLDVLESMGLEMKMFFDISVMKMYMTLHIDLPEERKKLGADSLYRSLKNKYAEKGNNLTEKDIVVNGVTGKELMTSVDGGDMKIQVFIPNLQGVVLNAVFSFNEKGLNDEESKRFFQSFVYDKTFKRPAAPEKQWSVHRYPQHSFSIEMPADPRGKKDVNSAEGKVLYEYTYVDIRSQVYYGMSLSTVKEGMYEMVDSNYFLNIKENLRNGFEDMEILDSGYFSLEGYPGFRVHVKGKTEGDLLESRVMAVSRGNRNYYLYVVYLPNETNRNSAARFLNSFTLLPYQYPAWKSQLSPDSSFTLLSPFSFRKAELGEGEDASVLQRYLAFDTITATTQYVDKLTLPQWLKVESDSLLFRKRAEIYRNWSDSVTGFRLSRVGDVSMADFTLESDRSFLSKKVRLVLNGNRLFEIYTHLTDKDLENGYGRFFESFRVADEKRTEFREGSYAGLLASLLQQPDSARIAEIKTWWTYLSFTHDDLPTLQRMMLKLYPDFDTLYNSNLNALIADKVMELDSAHSTIRFIRDNYRAIGPEHEYVKPFLISYLSRITTSESYGLLKNILANEELNIGTGIAFPHRFYDSIQLTATLFPEIMKWAGKEVLASQVLAVTTWLLDSNRLSDNAVKPFAKGFVAKVKKDLEADKKDIEENYYQYFDHITILGAIHTPEANALLNRFSKFDNRALRFRTLSVQLKNGQPVDNKTIYTLATTDEYRHDLYDVLKKTGKLKLFPATYLSQSELGKSKVYNYSSGEDFQASLIQYKKEKLLNYKGRNQRFIIYRVDFGGIDSESYLGVAGPFNVNPGIYESSHEATGIYWRSEYDAGRVDELFREYMKELEEGEKEDEDEVDLQPPPPPPPGVEMRPVKN